MAVKQKNTKGSAGGNELLENPEALASRVTKTEEFLEKNKVWVFSLGGIIALAIAGVFIFKYYKQNQNQKAQEEMFQAIYYFEADSLSKALSGDGNNLGFLDIIDEYGITEAANLAHYYSGAIYLKQGQYDEAISHLEEFSAKDLLVQARAFSLIGDAYMEKSAYEQAAKNYDKAADHKPNAFFTPQYLEKAALAYELAGNMDAAIARYNEIVEKYFNASEYENARKQVARLEAMASK